MALPPLVLQALAFAVDFLKPFGMEAVLQMSNSFRPFNTRQEMALSANTLTCVQSRSFVIIWVFYQSCFFLPAPWHASATFRLNFWQRH